MTINRRSDLGSHRKIDPDIVEQVKYYTEEFPRLPAVQIYEKLKEHGLILNGSRRHSGTEWFMHLADLGYSIFYLMPVLFLGFKFLQAFYVWITRAMLHSDVRSSRCSWRFLNRSRVFPNLWWDLQQ